jgi:hypothetical protein
MSLARPPHVERGRKEKMPSTLKTLWLSQVGLNWLTEQLKKLNARAKRNKLQPITLTVRDTVAVVKGGALPVRYLVTEPLDVEPLYFVAIKGESPKLDGWRLMATLQHIDGQTMVRGVPGEEVPLRFWEADPRDCDHCNKPRRRKDTYVVAHDDGRTAQVGSNCLRDYLGHASIASLVNWADILRFLDTVRDTVEEEGFGGGYAGESTWSPSGFLAVTAAVVGKFGWTSKGKAREAAEQDRFVKATASRAAEYIHGPRGSRQERDEWLASYGDLSVTDANKATAADALAWAGAIAQDDPSDYLRNVRVAATVGFWNHRMLGIGASIITAHARALGKLEERKRTASLAETSKHFGQPKQRLEFTATVQRITVSDGDFGISYGHHFLTTDGNAATWWASSEQDMVVGGTYRIKGTVKRHSEYRGVAQTAVNRCIVLDTITEPATAAEGSLS